MPIIFTNKIIKPQLFLYEPTLTVLSQNDNINNFIKKKMNKVFKKIIRF